MNLSIVNPGDGHSQQINLLPVSVPPEIFSQLDPFNSQSFSAIGLQSTLKRFLNCQNVEDQVSSVKQMCKDLSTVSEGECESYIKALVYLYFLSPFKHPVKSALAKALNSMTISYPEVIETSASSALQDKFKLCEEKTDMHMMITITANLYAYFTELRTKPSEDNATKILQFQNFVLQSCNDDLRQQSSILSADTCDLLLSASMVIVATLRCLKKVQGSNNVLKATLQTTSSLSDILFNHSELPYDILCNLGLALVLIMDLNLCNEWLNILDLDNETSAIHLSGDVQRLCVCHGLLSGLPHQSFSKVHFISQQNFLSRVLNELLNIHARAGHNGVITLGVTRTLLKGLSVPESQSLISDDILDNILVVIWKQLDHFTDSVRHATQMLLEHILFLHKSFQARGINPIEKIFTAVESFSYLERSRYVCLSVMAKHLGSSEMLEKVPNLISSLTESLLNPTTSSNASDALVALMTAHKVESKEMWISTWIPPLLAILSKPSTEAHNVENVLTRAVKLCPDVIQSVIFEAVSRDWRSIQHLSVIIMCLKIGRKLGLPHGASLYNTLTEPGGQDSKIWQNVDLFEILRVALTHEHDSVRSSALSVIVDTHRSTELLYEKELILAQEYLRYNINYDIPSARQNGLALFQKLLLRIKLCACVLQRKFTEEQSVKLFSAYQKFINNLQSFCFDNLFVGANFSRRCWALRILNVFKDMSVLDSTSKLHWNNRFFENRNISALMNIVQVDTFENNKKMATDILKSMPKEHILRCLLKDPAGHTSLLESGCSLALCNRPSDTISAAYVLQLALHFEDIPKVDFASKEITRLSSSEVITPLFRMIVQLLCLLETQLKTAKTNICVAAVKGPMYGTLFCIRTLLHLCDFSKLENSTAWNTLINDLTTLCFSVNAAVVGIVNSSSPEGHLPMDFGKNVQGKGEDSDVKVTAQMVLLCSWRTVKEISLLLGELSERCPIRPKNARHDDPGILDEDTLRVIGNHFLTLMEETKHRGAFEQAAVGFRQLVSRLWRYTGGDACEWPVKWLNEILDMIQSTSTASKLCATRRSAGIPFMVQALVGTEPLLSRNRPYLNSTMVTLLRLAGPSTTAVEQRTHAFNVLRALFRDACLGDFILPYVEEGFMVAIEGFRCMTWSERNSATLLFGALMTRLFGVRRTRGNLSSRNKMTSYTFFQNYPRLYSFLLEEIKLAGGSIKLPTSPDVATLHPVLLILGRLYPSSMEGLHTTVQLGMFVPWVRLCAGCCVHKTRCLAAEAIVPLIATNSCEKFIIELFSDVAGGCDSDTCHGLLLQSVSLLQSTMKTNVSFSENVANTFSKCLSFLDGTHSPMIELTLLQASEFLLQQSPNNLAMLTSLSERLTFLLTSIEAPKRIGASLSEAFGSRILLQLQVLLEIEPNDLVLTLMSHPVQEVAKEAVLFVYYMLADSDDVSFTEEFDDEEDGVDDILAISYERGLPWPLTLPMNKRNRFKEHLCSEKLSNLLVKRIIGANLDSDFQQIRYELSALSRLPKHLWASKTLVDVVLKFLEHPQESVKRSAVFCISSYWKYLLTSKDNVEPSDFKFSKTVCDGLLKMSSVESCLGNRMAAVYFLTEHAGAMRRNYSFLEDVDVCVLWMCAISLVRDEDVSVRQKAATLCSEEPKIASLALEKMVEQFVEILGDRNPLCQATLLLWAIGTIPDFDDEEADLEEDRVFDKGEMNTYAEEEILTDLACGFINGEVLQTLTEEHLRRVYTMLMGEEPLDSVEFKSALSLLDVVHGKVLNHYRKKSMSSQLMMTSRRVNKITQVVTQWLTSQVSTSDRTAKEM